MLSEKIEQEQQQRQVRSDHPYKKPVTEVSAYSVKTQQY